LSTDTEIGGISVSVGADLSGLNASLDQASRALQSTTDSMQGNFSLLSNQSSNVFDGLAGAVARAATSGRSSFQGMVDSMLAQLSRLAIRTFITNPLESVLSQVLKGFSFGGALAGGGPVAPGSTYLVGENGPELFSPSQSGRIVPSGQFGGGITVNIYAQDAPSVMRSQTQIAAMLARAAARGQRNL
jgi:phage-related minor tail protein